MYDRYEIPDLHELLETHRRRLRVRLEQQATFGAAYVPPHIVLDVEDARQSIREIKDVLRNSGETVPDQPDDKPYAETVITVSHHGTTPLRQVERNQIFISYSHSDRRWLDRLHVHLKPLERNNTIVRWDDTMIKPGSKWREEIDKALQAAKVAILLVSADFLASDFIVTNELPLLLKAAEEEGAIILPVIVSPSRFLQTKSLSQFQAVNQPSHPLAALPKHRQEDVLVKVADAVEQVLGNNP